MGLFQGIGVLLFIYSGISLLSGEVYAKDKWSGRTVKRSEEPLYYWTIIVIYFGLATACYFFF